MKVQKKENKSILTLSQRIEIDFDYHLGISISKIVEKIGKNRSTISYESAYEFKVFISSLNLFALLTTDSP